MDTQGHQGTSLTVRAVAEQLSVSAKFVRSEIRRGELQAFKVGRVYRVRPEALDHYVSTRETQQRSLT